MKKNENGIIPRNYIKDKRNSGGGFGKIRIFFPAKILEGYDILAVTMRTYTPASLPRMPKVNAITSRATVSVIPNMIM